MSNLVLYSTLGCHLCEQAKTVLWPVLSDYQLSLLEVDIADAEVNVNSDQLIARYGVRIPVIKLQDSESELGWPFSEEEVRQYITENLPV